MVSALVADGGRITWLGDESGAATRVDAVERIVDLDGALVLPGFVDAHVHLSMTGLGLRGVDLGTAPSLTAGLAAIEARVRRTGGRPVYAPNWQEANWPEARAMTHRELDRAAYGGVVYSPRVDVHSAIVSSALVAASGAAGHDGWLGDGLVVRDAHHAAREAFLGLVDPEQRRGDIEAALRAAAAAGITSVHECGGPDLSCAEDFADVLELGERADLPATVGYWAERVTSADQARTLLGRHRARGLGGDLNVDGSIGSRTAHLREPYADRPGHCGTAYLTADEVAEHVAACVQAGIQSGFHVIGDAGLDTALEGIAEAARRCGLGSVRAARVRLEHAEMADGAAIAEMARLGVIASVQPAFDAWWGGSGGMYAERLGRSRAAGMNPFGSLERGGVPLALGSDTPVTPFDPWGGIVAAMGHHQPGQRLGLSSALDAHTSGGHRAAREDHDGSIEVGADATFAAFATDLTGDGAPVLRSGDPAPRCLLTVRAGVVLYSASAGPAPGS